MKNILIFISIVLSTSHGNDTSKVVQTHKNGRVSIISYYHETKEGLELFRQETFHFSGPKSMVGNYKNGIRDGDWTYWYENGMKRLEGTYSNGFKNGLWTRWYGNGVTASKYTYDNTTFDGQVTDWHIDKECWDNKGNPCECGSSWWDDCENHK